MNKPISVRSFVADFTHEIHLKLHTHAAIGRLNCRDISVSEYRSLLRAYFTIYTSAEEQRRKLQLWPAISLHQNCKALAADLQIDMRPAESTLFKWADAPRKVIGMLYVLHGASFGGQVICRNLAANLPEVSKQYFGQGIAKGVWRDVLFHLESTGKGQEDLREIAVAAQKTFDIVDRTTELLPANDV